MSIVLIVSRTQMKNGVCVGGINESTLEFIRLHNERGGNLSVDAPFEVGDRWELDVETAWNKRPAPHTEDKQVKIIKKIENIGSKGVAEFVCNHELGELFVEGSLQDTFCGCLKLNGKQNYITEHSVPEFSTQFWKNDKDLVHREIFGKHYYCYDDICIKFVGFQDCVKRIPRGSIIRLSLANWWRPEGCEEDRCYLQLSGWYALEDMHDTVNFWDMTEDVVKKYAKETLTIPQFKKRFNTDTVEVIKGDWQLYIRYAGNIGYISVSLKRKINCCENLGSVFVSYVEIDGRGNWVLHSEFYSEEI